MMASLRALWYIAATDAAETKTVAEIRIAILFFNFINYNYRISCRMVKRVYLRLNQKAGYGRRHKTRQRPRQYRVESQPRKVMSSLGRHRPYTAYLDGY